MIIFYTVKIVNKPHRFMVYTYYEYINILVAIIFDGHRNHAMQFYLLKQFLKSMKALFVLRTHIRVFLCREKLMCRGKSAVNQTITPSIM